MWIVKGFHCVQFSTCEQFFPLLYFCAPPRYHRLACKCVKRRASNQEWCLSLELGDTNLRATALLEMKHNTMPCLKEEKRFLEFSRERGILGGHSGSSEAWRGSLNPFIPCVLRLRCPLIIKSKYKKHIGEHLTIKILSLTADRKGWLPPLRSALHDFF